MNENYRSYSPTRGNRLLNCKKNVIHIGSNELIRHELSKCVGAIMIHKWGDVKFDDRLIDDIKDMADGIESIFKDWDKDTTDFLTEAWSCKERRIDLVNLKINDHIEFETNHKISKDGAITIYI